MEGEEEEEVEGVGEEVGRDPEEEEEQSGHSDSKLRAWPVHNRNFHERHTLSP